MKQHAPHVRNAIYEALAFGCRNEPGFWFEMPVAQIKGSLDDRFPGAKSAMDALSGRLPPGFVEEVAGAGHLVHVEKPEAFQDSLGRLLHRLDGA
jgi:pimeloyl-ACP methyl ester carboxylesterase